MIIPYSQRWFIRLGVCMAAWLPIALAGCGGASNATVSGTVTFQGKPLPSGTVAFFGKDNQVASGAIESDGHYSVQRVPVGPVKISISTPPPPSQEAAASGMPTLQTIEIPAKYSDPAQSNLTFTVKPGSQEYPIKLD